MNLNDDDIKEFIEIWKVEFGETISEGDARVTANNLLRLFLILGSGQEPSLTELIQTMRDAKKPDTKKQS